MDVDKSEQRALGEFLRIFEEQHFDFKPTVITSRIHRTPDGQIIIRLSVKGESPSANV